MRTVARKKKANEVSHGTEKKRTIAAKASSASESMSNNVIWNIANV